MIRYLLKYLKFIGLKLIINKS